MIQRAQNGKGSAGLPGSTPRLAGEELSPGRTGDLSKVTQLDGGRFDTDNLASLSLKMHGPRQARMSLRDTWACLYSHGMPHSK